MTKPAITTRSGKGSALTYSELDTNFTNLQDATLSVTDGTNSHAFNLNDTITFTAGSNITLGVDPTTGAITINSSAGSNINTGVANTLAYYPSNGNTIDDTLLTYEYDSVGDFVRIKPTGITALILGSETGGPILVKTPTNSSFTTNNGFGAGGTIGTSIPTNIGRTHSGVFYNTVSAAFSGGFYKTIANTESVSFNDVAGMLITQNVSTGVVAMWLCGGGAATRIGTSTGSTTGVGSVTYYNEFGAADIGYRWTNTTGSTASIMFTWIQTSAQPY